MSKIPDFKRIESEGAPPEVKEVLDGLGYSLNTFGDDVVRGFTKGIGFDNLNQSLITFTVEPDANGFPVDQILIRYSITGLQGFSVISVTNLTDGLPPLSQPFISYVLISNNSVRIENITGLSANKTYQIKAIIIGS